MRSRRRSWWATSLAVGSIADFGRRTGFGVVVAARTEWRELDVAILADFVLQAVPLPAER